MVEGTLTEDVGAGFDGEAGDYLDRFCAHPSAVIMRGETHRWFRKYVQSGQRLLDLCCGPGPDFSLWQQLGLKFEGLDCSEGMLAEARKADAQAPLHLLDFNALSQVDGPFDCISANFGGLNTEVDLDLLARNCAELLAPQGIFFVNIMTRFPLAEIAEGILRGRHFFRRLRKPTQVLTVGGLPVTTHYYFPAAFFKHFSSQFQLLHVVGLGCVLPPPYVSWSGKGAGLLGVVDRLVGRCFPLNRAGDHTLLIMRRG